MTTVGVSIFENDICSLMYNNQNCSLMYNNQTV